MHLYLIRHADPDYEAHTLTPQGFREVDALVRRMAAVGLTHIHSSTANRALLTARPIAESHSLAVASHDWLLEPTHLRVRQDGRDFTIWDTYGETVRSSDAPLTQMTWQRTPPFDAPEVMEMWNDFRARADALIAVHGYERQGSRYRIRRGSGDRVAVVSHNGTVLLFLAHLLELPLPLVWCGFFAWPSSVTVIHFEEHSSSWAVPRALHIADVSHLYAEGLAPQPRALGAGRYEPFM
jgi:broad specificity phosphatase PhoE